jgi:hypothetical protein
MVTRPGNLFIRIFRKLETLQEQAMCQTYTHCVTNCIFR